MTSPLTKRLQALLSLLSVLLGLAVIAAVAGYFLLRGSLAQLDGVRPLPGLAASVEVARDALGVPLITAANRADAARALGFVHAQDRFFQMDLTRRRAAGELAELFGPAALELDKFTRRHAFRRIAQAGVAALAPAERALLDAYVDGVNAGLTALPRQPWEYYVLRTDPVPWRAEDSLLCILAMWIDLQDERGHYERSYRALYDAFGSAGVAFFAPRGDANDAALDDTFYPVPDLPPLRFSRTKPEEPTAALSAPWVEPALRPGSNSFAVAGRHTTHGAALLANDMHLGLNVPNTWYRATLTWNDATGATHQVSGVTLPGTPALVVGSNGRVAWGFTNSYIDTVDIVMIETDGIADIRYRTKDGWRDIEERVEQIAVRGGDPVDVTLQFTHWGPILPGKPADARLYALRWNAHDVSAINFGILRLETARSTAEALDLARRAGMPNNNILLADADGHIAWTLTGAVPKRLGYDGRLPTTWAYGDRAWEGWLPPEEVPTISDPPEGILWTANNRIVGGEAYARLGDNGYDDGFRASAIRDDLRELLAGDRKVSAPDLLAVQLDDRARYLERWRTLLLATLDDRAVATDELRREMRAHVEAWNGRASADSTGYRLLRAFRQQASALTLKPFLDQPRRTYAEFDFSRFMTEDSVWRLVTEKPARLLNPEFSSWDNLLLAAADQVLDSAREQKIALQDFTWGARNTLRMQHPFARFLPKAVAGFLSMPAEPLPGDSNLPRVQGTAFGASQRLVVAPGHEQEAIFHMPGGQSGHPLSPFFRAGHAAWVKGEPTPLLPGAKQHTLTLTP